MSRSKLNFVTKAGRLMYPDQGQAYRKPRSASDKANNALYTKARHRRLKTETFDAYGGRCVCCGEPAYVFLAIDHVYNDGAYERQVLKIKGTTLWVKLRREGWPKERYQLLCWNCNAAKQFSGGCPHSKFNVFDPLTWEHL